MAGVTARIVVSIVSLFGLVAVAVVPAAAQVSSAPSKLISSPGTSSQSPMITFNPSTGLYGIAYRERFANRWVGGFLDQDGNRVVGVIPLVNDSGFGSNSLRDMVSFPSSAAVLSTYQVYGIDVFGNNVFVGDAGGVAFVNNGVTSGLIDYTNSGGDKFNANNCGEHEEAGVSAADSWTNTLFQSYGQSQHFFSNGLCKISGSTLMAGYHLNGLPFGFSNGPFAIENGAFSQDAVFNPATGQVWFGYASATVGRLNVALMTPSGIAAIFNITPGGGGTSAGNLRLAVHPTTNNVLAVWEEFVNSDPTVKARLFSQSGVALTADITLSNPATERIQQVFVAATADNFFIAGYISSHVIGRVLTPAGSPASNWTQLDFLKDAFGNPQNVNFGVDLVANPVRGTYGLVVDSFNDIFFIEVTASAGVPLTVVKSGTGTGVVTSNPPGINCPGTCTASFPPGTNVTLSAAPAAFSDFTGWAGDCTGTAACAVGLTTPKSVGATFTRRRYSVAVNKIGSGTVTSSPAGINCGPSCAADFDGGSFIQLSASPAAGWRFAGWSGACTGATACDVQVVAADSVTATFIQQFTLSVTSGGNGGGQMTSDPVAIACPGASCSITVDAGSSVQLFAAADATSRFAGWSGACSGSGACVITVSSDLAANASFARQFDLQAVTNGSGTVSSSPSGIACPVDCSERFDTGANITLTATPAAGWRFTGWSGDPACTGSGACVVSRSAYEVATVTASFIEQFALNVSMAGNGSGSVSGPGIACAGDCSETYDANAVVTLTATPVALSDFTGWSGACSGTGACVVTMAAAQSVTATFTRPTYPLSVTLAGAGSGSVNSAPAGINCGGVCASDFNTGTVVTLTATAGATSTFAGWTGACGGTGACVVTINAAQSVTAHFDPVTIASVSTQIAALAPSIGAGNVNSVTGKLSNAQASLNRGNANAAANQLNAAINDVRALVRSGRLGAAAGAALIASLQQIIAGL